MTQILFHKKRVKGAFLNAITHETQIKITPTQVSCGSISVLARKNPHQKDTPKTSPHYFSVDHIRAWIDNHPNETYLPIMVIDDAIMLI